MESTDGHDANNVASARTDVELIEEETNFANEVSDGELEAAASGPTVTFTLSIVLFACRFC